MIETGERMYIICNAREKTLRLKQLRGYKMSEIYKIFYDRFYKILNDGLLIHYFDIHRLTVY